MNNNNNNKKKKKKKKHWHCLGGHRYATHSRVATNDAMLYNCSLVKIGRVREPHHA